MPTAKRSLSEFLTLKGGMGAMLAMLILVGLGERMAERYLPLYIIALGGGTIIIGLLNAMDNLLGALYSIPGGYLAQRLGYRKALALFNILSIVGYLIVIIFPVWQAVIVGAFFFLSWSAISLPATMDLVSKQVPENRRAMGVTMSSITRRIPKALGPVLGGILITAYGTVRGVRYAFCAAIVLTLVSLILQQIFIKEAPRKEASAKPKISFRLPKSLRDLLISDILIRFCDQIPFAFIVVWVVQNNGFSAVTFGILTTIEMVVALLVYIPVAYLADRSGKRPFVAITFLNFTLFPLLLMFSTSFPMLVLAFIVRGLKEFGEPTRKALILDLAPPESKALSFGTYYFMRDTIVSIAAFGGAFLWKISPQVNMLTATAFGIIGLTYFLLSSRFPRQEPL